MRFPGKARKLKSSISKDPKNKYENKPLTSENLKAIFSDNEDVIFGKIKVNNAVLTVLYIEGMVDDRSTSEFILRPLKQDRIFKNSSNEKEIIKSIQEGSINIAYRKTHDNINEVIKDIFNSCTAVIFDREKKAVTFRNRGYEEREISEPTYENVIKGAKDSFVESLRTNTATIRGRIKSGDLKIESTVVGSRTQTTLDIIYMKSIANEGIVTELKKRIKSIDNDNALTLGAVVEYITDRKYVVFPQVIQTERPDKFCANIIEGRVGIIIEGLPLALIIPATLLQCLQSPEDYSRDSIVGSIIRFMRFSLMLLTLFLPAFYTSITTFHHEMIPSELAVFIQATKKDVPFPSFVEVIFLLIAFEILIEAGSKLPRTVGQAISIVGAIVVGQAAVQARLVSPGVVVVIALTAISSFAMPNQDLSNALRLWRFIFVICSSLMGLFGMTAAILLLLLILSSIESFGVPYLSPFVASDYKDYKDTVFRFRYPEFYKRPEDLNTKNPERR